MKRVRWLSGVLSLGMLSFTLATVGTQVAHAQRAIPWSDMNCQVQGWWRNLREDIVIGRELYTSVLRIYPGTSLTCKLPGGQASLRLEFVIPETKAPIQLDVYVDGNQVASRTGKNGKLHTMLVDVSNGKSLSLDIDCAEATGCIDHGGLRNIMDGYNFIKFQIEPGASSPGSL
ncbi:MAG TPA: hypothetical protein DCQ51_17440 [Planktothrix sp. UBA8407]|jgi:hypothetical protein|nr:hypothetical protein [Planktothrix sp. UBA8407]